MATPDVQAPGKPVLHIRSICKTYGSGESAVHALRDIDLEVRSGEFLVLLGASGSGKSTLLNILGGLDVPTGGEVDFFEHSLTHATDDELTGYRREHVGFVFQFYNLIPSLSQLAQEGFVSPSRLDTTRLAVTAARRELDIASAEREVARQEQAQASAALMPAAASVKGGRSFAVQSPISGVVLRVPQPSEATIAAGAALLDIGDPARMEVVSELLTADAVQAQPGHRVVIERWGGPPLEGRVRRVEPAAFTKVSALGIEEQRVNVLIDITDPPDAWRIMGDGFRVGVRIVTASTEGAVLVPVGALFPQGQGMAVYRLDGRKARLQTVEVAARNATMASVRNGLAPGQTVVVYPPAALADGRTVQVRTP